MPLIDLQTLTPPDDAALVAEATAGLLAEPASLPPKFFYDEQGSRLFEAITALDEYYPTRTEAAIFEQQRATIARAVLAQTGPRPALLDIGAGNGAKAAGWFDALHPRRYVAVDISAPFLHAALLGLARTHPALPMVGLGLDFGTGLALPASLIDGPALVFYPGSSIGNFGDADARRLLADFRRAAAGGAVLIGFDRVKPQAVLEAAYDDALGVTAAFNLNLLRHLNRLLGSDFDPRQWQHQAVWDGAASRIEMRLVARQALRVTWPGHARRFAAGEAIDTEHSRKWTPEGFDALLHSAGLEPLAHWSDPRGWFSVVLAR